MEELTTKQWNKIKDDNKIVLKFYTTNCAPCKKVQPILDEFENEFDEYDFYKVDAARQRKITQEFSIMSVPTIIVWNGEETHRIIPGENFSELKNLLKE